MEQKFFVGWSKTPDLRAFLAWRLARVVGIWWQTLPSVQFDAESVELLEQKFLALRRMKGDRPTVYWSAIALQLIHRVQPAQGSPFRSEQLPQIAQELATTWNQANLTKHLEELEQLNKFWQHCVAEAMPNGMIALRVSDAGLAWWLQFLGEGDGAWDDRLPLPALELPFLKGRSLNLKQGELTASQPQLNAKALFEAQAAHARCCSILRLADQEGLVRLLESASETGLDRWVIVYPDPIPWMQDEQTLRLTHPAERRLIAQLLTTFETLCPQSPSLLQILRSADEIAQSFQQFYAACRIFSEVKTQLPELAQARLGLVGITRLVLYRLLSDGLNAIAPPEL